MDGIEKEFVIRTLRSLLNDYGLELYKQEYSQKFYGIVSDSFGSEYSKYRKLLKLAIQEKIPARILSKDKRPDEEKLMFLSELNKSFAGEYDIKLNTAEEIVEILAEGLNWNLNKKKSCEFENKVKQSISLELKEDIKMKRKYNFVKAFTIVLVLFIFSLAVKNSGASDYPSQPKEVQEVTSTQTTIEEEKPLTQQEIRAAINAYNAGNYKASVPTLKKAAEQNHAEAAFYYANALRYGRGGFPRNINSAIEWLNISAQGGFVQALNSNGIIYRDSIPDGKTTAFKYFKKGAQAEIPDPYAVYNYASCLASGLGCSCRDNDEAINYFQKGINYCYLNQLKYPQSVMDELREDMVKKLIETLDDAYTFSNIESVAAYLTKGVQRPYDRLYLCAKWLTENIAYDTTKSEHTAYGTFKKKSGCCDGYAKCLNAMLDTLGISNQIVNGNYVNGIGHCWNVVWIDNRQIFLDVTWAAGYVDSSTNVYVKHYNPKWFDTPYAEFAERHIPG